MKKLLVLFFVGSSSICFGKNPSSIEQNQEVKREVLSFLPDDVEEEFKEIYRSLPNIGDDGFSNRPGHWNYKHFSIAKEVISLLSPNRILEIGTRGGHSALLWLFYSQAEVITVDLGLHKSYSTAMQILDSHFEDQFIALKGDSKYIFPRLESYIGKIDMIFIDGDHSTRGVVNDITLAKELKIPYLLFDDMHFASVRKGIDLFLKNNEMQLIQQWNVDGSPRVALYRLF